MPRPGAAPGLLLPSASPSPTSSLPGTPGSVPAKSGAATATARARALAAGCGPGAGWL